MRLNDGLEIVSTYMGATVCAVDGWHQHDVKIVVADNRPGGCTMDIQLSAEDAANFASAIYSLAKMAMIKTDRDAAGEHPEPLEEIAVAA